MRSVADYVALLETRYTTSEAAKYLKVDVSRVRKRLRERSLLGIDYDGERRLPRFQFERRQVLPGLREVIAALPEGLNPLDVAQWFLAPNPDLEAGDEAMSPREWPVRGSVPGHAAHRSSLSVAVVGGVEDASDARIAGSGGRFRDARGSIDGNPFRESCALEGAGRGICTTHSPKLKGYRMRRRYGVRRRRSRSTSAHCCAGRCFHRIRSFIGRWRMMSCSTR